MFRCKKYLAFLVIVLCFHQSKSQSLIPLNDFSFFYNPSNNWKIATSVQVNPDIDNHLVLNAGQGILVNMPANFEAGDIFTRDKFGDADISLDYILAKGSHSGIFLQGRYEVQLVDSWGKINPSSADNGGINERWDENKPEGRQAYDGYPPRQNVSRAPGLWQNLRISFQAPRFDVHGNKVSNARMLQVWLNGVLIHENVELSGPTRGALDNEEVPEGPLRIQDNNGALAIRNLRITNFEKPRSYLSALKYKIYKGSNTDLSNKNLKPVLEGNTGLLTSNVSSFNNDFLLSYSGLIEITKAGEYRFALNVPGGNGLLQIDSTVVMKLNGDRGFGKIQLQPGNFSFQLTYAKSADWVKPALGLTISGPGIRELLLSDANVSNNNPVPPILIQATSNQVLRSFVDLPGRTRVTHAVNVGSTNLLHYTYDLNHGMLVQVWRGDFLNASPMWHDRGDGSSRVAGSVQYLGKPVPALFNLANPQVPWANDTVGTGYRPKGYILKSDDLPKFRYLTYGTLVDDDLTIMMGGKGIQRKLVVENQVADLFMLLATGNSIENLGNGLYAVDDKSYYIRIDDLKGTLPILRNSGGRQELIAPVQKSICYSIIF